MESPTLRVPRLTSTVATAPRPRSTLASSTTPLAGASRTALSSRTSACSRIASSRRSCRHRSSRTPARNVLAAPLFRDHRFLGQFVGAFRVGIVLVDLVDRDDDRHIGRLGVLDRFFRLRMTPSSAATTSTTMS
jgi:hypothetical protein